MSEHFPRPTAKELIRALKKLGFFEAGTLGSHVILVDAEGSRKVSVPFHSVSSFHSELYAEF
ncbi:MAG TPA: type II toxin-antitoxin system HicA family toxin [Candidatus Kapabacteria bacterium]|jgi:predicted RNA binding protein YcfA (HicA-like mRNA interferase family)